MEKYTTYLATKVINDSSPVTYRSLSRELQIHGHLAKQMLYEFHTSENARKPKSVHATYIVSGIKKAEKFLNQDVDDMVMESSPIHSQSIGQSEDQIPVQTVTLVREEELEILKSLYESFATIHIYSLQPASPNDIHQITSVNQRLFAKTAKSDPREEYKICGSITNRYVSRREPLNKANAVIPSVVEIKKQPPALKKESSSNISVTNSKGSKGGLAASFAKTKPKDAAKPKSLDKPKVPSPRNNDEDVEMHDALSDDDDDYEEDPSLFDGAALDKDPQETSIKDKERAERETKLKAMMDLDDDENENENDEIEHISKKAQSTTVKAEKETEVEEDEDEDEDQKEEKEKAGKKENEEEDKGPKRRRGRRRVTKKKTYTDEDGYLVTKEEQEWESFSEDEPQIKKPKSAISTTSATSTKKKATGKAQGNIMAFFGKK